MVRDERGIVCECCRARVWKEVKKVVGNEGGGLMEGVSVSSFPVVYVPWGEVVGRGVNLSWVPPEKLC